jgi:hypothetical protein
VANTLHHDSHVRLLRRVPKMRAPTEPIDAIIVPTFRPAPQIDHALHIAREARCQVLVLCSGEAKAVEVVRRVPDADVRLAAIDVTPVSGVVGHLVTTKLSNEALHGRDRDIGFKRNLGLLIAWVAGWRRVAFIDDDIEMSDVTDLTRAAAALTSKCKVVGLANVGYPDNSVVCHAHRLAGGHQDTFIGGGAMVVSTADFISFFPETYNEDWFFLLDHEAETELVPTARIGKVSQKTYDPYDHPDRARREEFGDTLAEGLYWLLDQRKRISTADERHWRRFLKLRRLFIEDVMRRVDRCETDDVRELSSQQRQQVAASLEAAHDTNAEITPDRCVEYLQAWQKDRLTWSSQVRRYPQVRAGTPRAVLTQALDAIEIPRQHVHRIDR